jgi:hypothetical protein
MKKQQIIFSNTQNLFFLTDPNLTSWEYGLCDGLDIEYFAMRWNDIEKIGGSWFLTEFGLCDEQDPQECAMTMNRADEYFASWLYWDYSDGGFFNASGLPKEGNVRLFSRTFARRIAGTPRHMEFDPESAFFELEFTPSVSVAEYPYTEIYLNEKYHYPQGFQVEVSPTKAATWSKLSPNILIFHTQQFQSNITIRITPIQ